VTGSTTAAALPAGVTLRPATARDIPTMMEMINPAFEEEAFFVNRPRTNPAQLAEHFRSGHFLLAHQGALLLASAYYEVRGEHGYLGMLAVRPGHQRAGMGRAILQATEGILRDAGCRIAELTVVNVRTKLLCAYRKLGYRDAGFVELPDELREKLTMPIQLVKMEKPL
jgi:GNAT superfamily N-acetyltransferase